MRGLARSLSSRLRVDCMIRRPNGMRRRVRCSKSMGGRMPRRRAINWNASKRGSRRAHCQLLLALGYCTPLERFVCGSSCGASRRLICSTVWPRTELRRRCSHSRVWPTRSATSVRRRATLRKRRLRSPQRRSQRPMLAQPFYEPLSADRFAVRLTHAQRAPYLCEHRDMQGDNMKRTALSTFVAAIAFAALVPAVAQTTVKLGYATTPTSHYGVGSNAFCEEVEKRTSGRYKCQQFPGAALGGEREMIEAVQLGTLDIVNTSTGPVG